MAELLPEQTISAIVHTRNSEATLAGCLRTLAWVDELLVIDMESSDGSVDIAREYGATVIMCAPAPRVDGIRNRFVEKARGPWILVLDSDEYLADDAGERMRSLIREKAQRVDAFSLPRYNYIAGQVMRGSGWYPDHQIRLFKKGAIVWEDSNHTAPRPVSPAIRVERLDPPDCLHIHHRNYESLSHFIQKQVVYAQNNAYDPDPEKFDFQDYLAESYEAYTRIYDPLHDGDVSRALALIMAWDSIIRGLIHWDRLEQKPPLGEALNLPLASTRLPLNSSWAAGTFTPGRIRGINRARRSQRIKESAGWKALKHVNRFLITRVFPPHTRLGKCYLKLLQWLKATVSPSTRQSGP